MRTSINNYFQLLKQTLDNLDRTELETFINILLNARDKGRCIYIMGNGGSASTASHFVCDFNKGMSYGKDKRFKVICLNDNIPTMMAYSNDISYEDIFVEQLKNFLNEDDVVIGISGSGNSKNILKAIEYANSKGAVTIGLTGYDGGVLRKICRHSINANINNMQVSEDIHIMICHMIHSVMTSKADVKELIYG